MVQRAGRLPHQYRSGEGRLTILSLDYAPSLKRTEASVVTKVRRLRPPCRMHVSVGQKVEAGRTLAILEEPGQSHMIVLGDTNLAMPADILLTYLGFDYIGCVRKRTGEHVSKGEILARRKPLASKERIYRSPYEGVLYLLREPGVVGIREIREINVTAFIPGTVSSIVPDREIALETPAAVIQGTYGIGGETSGELRVVVDSPSQIARVDVLTPHDKDRILVCGSSLQTGFLEKAKNVGARGIVVAGMSDEELSSFVGFGPGMITGNERVGLTLIMTEGFGGLPMLDTTFDILKRFQGKVAYINGSTQMRAGVLRPEVIIPRDDLTIEDCRRTPSNSKELGIGRRVRILGGQYFGRVGLVSSSPTVTRLETGSETQTFKVELEGLGSKLIPRSNVEPLD
jgi:hypothetical protein